MSTKVNGMNLDRLTKYIDGIRALVAHVAVPFAIVEIDGELQNLPCYDGFGANVVRGLEELIPNLTFHCVLTPGVR